MTASPKSRVLVIEDDEEIRDCLHDVLSDAGYQVSGACNGRDALNKLRASADLPHVILLDLLMPVMDGAEFRAEQRKDASLSQIPVVVVSANAQLRERAESMNVAAWLAKPVAVADLLNAVEKQLVAKPL